MREGIVEIDARLLPPGITKVVKRTCIFCGKTTYATVKLMDTLSHLECLKCDFPLNHKYRLDEVMRINIIHRQ